jgi:hypothetical protein
VRLVSLTAEPRLLCKSPAWHAQVRLVSLQQSHTQQDKVARGAFAITCLTRASATGRALRSATYN